MKVRASGPKSNVSLAAIGMSPQKWEVGGGTPFVGPSGKIFNEALATQKIHRTSVYVTNLCEFYIDDNDLYSVPKEIMDIERQRVFRELETVQPNCLIIMGGDTLDLLTATSIITKYNRKTGAPYLVTIGSKSGITKWRGSIISLTLPNGRSQKCVVAMHPAAFIRGQWKWLPLYKYIDVPRAVIQSSFPEVRVTKREAIVGPSFRTACDWLREANQQPWVSIDYEGRKHITCLGSGWTASQALCIPISRVGNPSYWTMTEELEIWRLWCALLQNPKVKKIAQNAAYEWIKSWLYGIYPNPLGCDTMHMHHCLYPDFGGIMDEWSKRKRDIDNPGHGLALLTSQYTDQPYYKDDGRHWTPELGEELFWQYNCTDVMVTFEIAMKEISELRGLGLWDTYIQNYLTPFEPSMRMEWYGVLQDIARRDAARITMKQEIGDYAAKLKGLTGYEIITKAEKKGGKPKPGILNLASPKQMQHWLYVEKGYKARVNRKTGNVTVDKDAIQALAIHHNDDSLRIITKMKQAQDLINDVIDAKVDEAGCLHCHHKLGGTNGTRWSTTESILGSGTNLQNLPRQGIARSLFLPG